MIYTKGLENLVLKRHLLNNASELLILGGFIGPSPVSKIAKETINSKIIYGCKVQASFNETFDKQYKFYSKNSNTEVFYKKSYNHSKIYCWHDNGNVIEIIAGSANFSNNGLTNDYEEILFEVDSSDYNDVYQYLQDSLNDSESCLTYNYKKQHISKLSKSKQTSNISFDKILSSQPPSARISFRDRKGLYTQINSGPRYSANSHVNINDCTIGLKTALVEGIPKLFPNNGINPMIGKGHGRAGKKSKFNVEFLWDDGEIMDMSFEQKGKKKSNGHLYKGLRSSGHAKNSNAKLGKYLRKRMGLKSGALFTSKNFKNYGRDHFDLTLMDDGIYYADFSVNTLSKSNNDQKE